MTLRRHAKRLLMKRLTKNTPLDELQRQLEGTCVVLKNIQIRMSKEAGMRFFDQSCVHINNLAFFTYLDHCKERTRLRGLQTKAKSKADKIMALINESNPLIAVTEEHFKQESFHGMRKH